MRARSLPFGLVSLAVLALLGCPSDPEPTDDDGADATTGDTPATDTGDTGMTGDGSGGSGTEGLDDTGTDGSDSGGEQGIECINDQFVNFLSLQCGQSIIEPIYKYVSCTINKLRIKKISNAFPSLFNNFCGDDWV